MTPNFRCFEVRWLLPDRGIERRAARTVHVGAGLGTSCRMEWSLSWWCLFLSTLCRQNPVNRFYLSDCWAHHVRCTRSTCTFCDGCWQSSVPCPQSSCRLCPGLKLLLAAKDKTDAGGRWAGEGPPYREDILYFWFFIFLSVIQHPVQKVYCILLMNLV